MKATKSDPFPYNDYHHDRFMDEGFVYVIDVGAYYYYILERLPRCHWETIRDDPRHDMPYWVAQNISREIGDDAPWRVHPDPFSAQTPYRMYFRNPEDAVKFKLVWC